MRRYYWAAKAVSQLSQILLLNIEERLNPSTHAPRPINARFFEKAGLIEVASDDLYERDPHAILETFLLHQTTSGLKDLSARTLRALYNARGVMDGAFRRDPVNRAAFMRILQQPSGITHAMRLMNQTSVLGRYLWAFRGIVGQMQHDLFHVYTVDQHILMVLRNMRRFFMAEHTHEYPFCSQLAAGWDKPWILMWRPFPRHRQGPRRRPFADRRHGSAALLPTAWRGPRRRPAHRVPGTRAPHHEHGGAKAGPE
jgi:UTP:GlnB (protein PII) uridylyltransferase